MTGRKSGDVVLYNPPGQSGTRWEGVLGSKLSEEGSHWLTTYRVVGGDAFIEHGRFDEQYMEPHPDPRRITADFVKWGLLHG